ncbi:unnamed protein product, partial [Lepidochelys kempii]
DLTFKKEDTDVLEVPFLETSPKNATNMEQPSVTMAAELMNQGLWRGSSCSKPPGKEPLNAGGYAAQHLPGWCWKWLLITATQPPSPWSEAAMPRTTRSLLKLLRSLHPLLAQPPGSRELS